jgi:hypothetical protein
MSICLIIFSNSEYSYLWKIIEETIKPLHLLNPVFISDITDIEKPEGFDKYIEYDSNVCYSKRWHSILPQIVEDYILVVHDTSIILNCEIEKMLSLVKTIDINKIDRFSLNVFNASTIIPYNYFSICDLNSDYIHAATYIPFDCCPCIWNKNSFLKLWQLFPTETYRSCELNISLQTFCKQNFKSFGLQKNEERVYYCLNRPYYNLFKILHITIKGELLSPIEVYQDMKDDFLKIDEKYSLTGKIKTNDEYKFLLKKK